MHTPYWPRRCIQTLRARILTASAANTSGFKYTRSFASRPSPGFNAASPSKGASKPTRKEIPNPGATGPSGTGAKAPRQNSETESPPKTGFRIRYGKIFLFTVFAYMGYRVYTWQISPKRSVILNGQFFTPFILEAREKVSSTSSILYLLSLPLGQNTENISEVWKRGIWSVQVGQPELQIARFYTPLPPKEGSEPEEIRLLVRQNPQGEVSSFLHRINRGTIVHLRGPKLQYELPEDVDEVLFLAGGTGIAPALQVAHTLFDARKRATESGPELRILWANRRREDSIDGLKQTRSSSASQQQVQTRLVEEVESMKARHNSNVIVDYFIDEESSYITADLLRTYLHGSDEQTTEDGPARRRLLFVSGPDGFVNHFAGPKTWKGGRELQGPLGGVLATIDPKGWEIWKL